eukprot:gnl/Trimastix_PCT/2397.p1 GENE.gnl/Trimastix_PCT/2397~~gnl/Trimastix_PCT/2397.p1  ORF type:complete len:367 (+),score=76.92 gnl/Trimastix_PCT/2397:444-1544(+)
MKNVIVLHQSVQRLFRMELPSYVDVTYKQVEDNQIRCLACRHNCLIRPGQSGICGVRKNVEGILKLEVYGYSISCGFDPVEKKPLYHFLPGTNIFSIGTIGCNFACDFCQNWQISQVTRETRGVQATDIEESAKGRPLGPAQAIASTARRGCRSLAFTYNEPTIFAEYAIDTAKLGRERGMKAVFVTNGYETPELLDAMRPYIDALNIDLKSFSERFYQTHCKARLAPVLDTIRQAHAKGFWVELTTLLIPGENDSNEELRELTQFIASVDPNIPWHISAFHPDYKMLNKPRTPIETLRRAKQIGEQAGLRYIYMGNVLAEASTVCPQCGAMLIRRYGMRSTEIVHLDLERGVCGKCGEHIPGIWS